MTIGYIPAVLCYCPVSSWRGGESTLILREEDLTLGMGENGIIYGYKKCLATYSHVYPDGKRRLVPPPHPNQFGPMTWFGESITLQELISLETWFIPERFKGYRLLAPGWYKNARLISKGAQNWVMIRGGAVHPLKPGESVEPIDLKPSTEIKITHDDSNS